MSRQLRVIAAALCAAMMFCTFIVPAAAETPDHMAEQAESQNNAEVVPDAGEDAAGYCVEPASADVYDSSRGRAGVMLPSVLPLYFSNPVDSVSIRVFFEDSTSDVPYINADTMFQILERVLSDKDITLRALYCQDQHIAAIRGGGPSIVLDFRSGMAIYRDLDGFFRPGYTDASPDILAASGMSGEDGLKYFERSSGSFRRAGRDVTVNLTERGIPFFWKYNTGFLPMQTFSDLFLAPAGASLVYNGQMAAVICDGDLDGLEGLYYAPPRAGRSQELADYTYNELCLALDLFYGLKSEHNIESFDTFFRLTGLETALRSTDSSKAAIALATLTDGYLGDIVSRITYPSFRVGRGTHVVPATESPSFVRYKRDLQLFRDARAAAYPDGAPPYEEIEDTAFITVSSFNDEQPEDDYTGMPQDVIGLAIYAHRQITREDSPIRNVVVDISTADGDDVAGAVYLMGWLTGKATVDVNDTLTGAQSSVCYSSDVTLDGVLDEEDSLDGLNRFVLISPAASAAGSTMAASLAGTDVHLVGQSTSAGACQTLPLSLADGTIIRISGNLRVSSLINGSYYDVNEGTAPQFRLASAGSFYDRQKLSEYIRRLY